MWSWLAVSLSGFISITSIENNQPKQAIFFSCFSMLLLLCMLWGQGNLVGRAEWWVSLGLIISMVADGLYITKRFKRICFASFIAAQLCYSTAFWLVLSGQIIWWLAAMLLAMGIVAFFLLLPKIDRLIFPVVIMGMVLLQLNWVTGEFWMYQKNTAALCAFIGSLTLTTSAVMLAIHDYRQPIVFGRYLISGSYLLAHCLITASFII
ncbi:lysoplasmalogenase [Vibrio taketomensis]|uniref:lysoplasmalogenase n=1 Tax=Vibrio taketomensis TaxID=2572923 RepID=UPI0013899908|nr:lysoplasmalogenase [Vibrio taketomensis]